MWVTIDAKSGKYIDRNGELTDSLENVIKKRNLTELVQISSRYVKYFMKYKEISL